MTVQVQPLCTARNVAQAMAKAVEAEHESKLEVRHEIESGQYQELRPGGAGAIEAGDVQAVKRNRWCGSNLKAPL